MGSINFTYTGLPLQQPGPTQSPSGNYTLIQQKYKNFMLVHVVTATTNPNDYFTLAIPYVSSTVTAQYKDEEGNAIADDAVTHGMTGDPYTTSAKTVEGYSLKATPQNASGSYTDAEQTVTYVYVKDPVLAGAVTVHYVDEEGKSLSEDVVLSGIVGDSYASEPKSIDGYTLSKVEGSASGTFDSATHEVTYVYNKNNDGGTPTPGNPNPSEPTPVVPTPGASQGTGNQVVPSSGPSNLAVTGTNGYYAVAVASALMVAIGTALRLFPRLKKVRA